MLSLPPSIRRREVLIGSAAAAIGSLVASESQAQAGLAGRDLLKDKRPIIHPDGPKFGAYDPHGDFRTESGVATEHLFLPWEGVDLSTLGAADQYAAARGRKIMITIEPWSWAKEANVPSAQLRAQILAGRHDGNMTAILNAVAGFKSPLIIRWAQEMESKTGRFTWQNWNPNDYIKAYRRMTDLTRKILPKAIVIWSPKGEKNLKDYYPGSDYVDIVGLSVFGLEDFDKIEYGRPRNFVESLQQGYDLSVGFKKPIWVAELGYEGGLDYLAKWVQDSTFNHAQFPELKEVVYFNDREVWEWPYNLGLPQWRVVRDAPSYPARS